ncbi:UDP-N-acetylmuramate dehydrogenase [Candidatus Dependentiae bacterium]
MRIIQENTPLKNKNWFQTGGTAKFYTEPTNNIAFQEALAYADNKKLPIFVLGKGANILISDNGFDGLVIKPELCEITHEKLNNNTENNTGNSKNILVQAGAGVPIENLIHYCLEHNITGLEEFSGIPGTVGGSVYINIHYFKHFLSDFLHQAQVINKTTGKIKLVDQNWFNFGYDKSKLFEKNYFLTQATFKLKKATDLETAYAKGRSVEITRHRNARYPNTHTCGSFFRNFLEHEVTQTISGSDKSGSGKKMIYVAYYLDKLGIKGQLSYGGAIISHKHANMIVNTGNATSQDIINLAREMQQLVKKNFGIIPQPECQLIGFDTYPLLR